MEIALLLAIATTFAFDLTNGFHDSANSIAALVATRAARPGPALMLAAAGNFAGPLLVGTAVADTVGGVVELPADATITAVGAAVTAAIAWNLLTWRLGLPSSSSHALVGGLVGASLVAAGMGGVHWGGSPTATPRASWGFSSALQSPPSWVRSRVHFSGRSRGGSCDGPGIAHSTRSERENGSRPPPSHSATEPTMRRSPWA
jgi:PiT family inorganic phosphate transporter